MPPFQKILVIKINLGVTTADVYQSDGNATRRKIVAMDRTKMSAIVVSHEFYSLQKWYQSVCVCVWNALLPFYRQLNDILCFYPHKFLVRKTFCRNNEFLCSNGEQCIPQGWVCDRARDCSDGSDEQSCGGKSFNKTEATNSIHDSLPLVLTSVEIRNRNWNVQSWLDSIL